MSAPATGAGLAVVFAPEAGTDAARVAEADENAAASIDSRHFGPLPLSGVPRRVEPPDPPPGPPRSPRP